MHLQQHQLGSTKPVAAQRRAMICEYLVKAGKLSPENIGRALRLQAEQNQREKIGSILVKLGLVSERDVAEGLRDQLGLRLVDRHLLPATSAAKSEISFNFLKKHKALVLEEDKSTVTLVMADPLDEYVIDAVKLCMGKAVRACVGVPAEIEAVLRQIERGPAENQVPCRIESVQFLDDVEHLKELAGEAPIIKLVNQTIIRAAESNASDIHIEPFEGHLKIRLRIDGVLREIEAPPIESAAAVISRVKIMANLNIAERRLAQDGRFRHTVRGIDFDFRVSTIPTMYGESVVMRLLQRDQSAQDFESLGFTSGQADEMRDILSMPHGILLVTGPTGSGKSTTLYAALSHLNDPERMIITVEDPVEYNIAGINQMQVKPQIGLTFASALRSIVRQDPDVIMIGEMRDTETAQIAVQSALTGHLVLSTLHTNDAPGSVMRLIDMGVQDYLLTSAVNAVQAQRLVRRLCENCKESYEADEDLVRLWGLDGMVDARPVVLCRPRGCSACGDTGYSGRSAILEILRVSDGLRSVILNNADASEIRRHAISEGMVPMRRDGLLKALAGITSVDEVLRVTPE